MEYLQVSREGHIETITLNKPPLNAMNLAMYNEITAAFREVNRNDDTWVVVFRAEGKFFSVGNDVNDFSGEYNMDYIKQIDDAIRSVFECRVPVVAAVQGAAIGGGFTMVSASDIVLAAPGTKFSIPEAKLGKVGGATGASFSLPQKVVRYMSLTGDTMLAEDLFPYGFIRKIVPLPELKDAAMNVAKMIVNNPPLSVRYTKESLNRIYEAKAQLAKNPIDHEVSLKIAGSADAREALAAFAEKRPPVYTGK